MSLNYCCVPRERGDREEGARDPGREEGDRGEACGTHGTCPLSRCRIGRQVPGEADLLWWLNKHSGYIIYIYIYIYITVLL